MKSAKTFALIIVICAIATEVGALVAPSQYLVAGCITGAAIGGIIAHYLRKKIGWNIDSSRWWK